MSQPGFPDSNDSTSVEPLEAEDIKALIDHVQALMDLNLWQEASEIIDRMIMAAPCKDVLMAAIGVFNRQGRFLRAAVCADELLKRRDNLDAFDVSRITHALGFCGRLDEAYEIQRSTSSLNNGQSLIRLYGLACKANRLGRHADALMHLLGCFSFRDSDDWVAHRKIFIDTELSSLWEKIPALDISLRQAMRYCNLPFDEIIAANEPVFPLRYVDHFDLHFIPERFHPLLQPVHETCFEVSPTAEAANPDLAADYTAWQETTVAPRLEAFRTLRNRIRSIVIDQQLAFAEFQALRGRFGCARNHIVCHLLNKPGANLENLPDIPALRPLVEEFRAQHRECPEAFNYLISWQSRNEPERFLKDVLPEMPPVNRNSGYALLAAGMAHNNLGNNSTAVQFWSACAQQWPLDDAPVMNAAMILSGEERWDEASSLLNRLPDECMESMLWRRASSAIRERRAFCLSSKAHPTPRIPTPTFGNLYSGADEEFLVQHKKFTPITQ